MGVAGKVDERAVREHRPQRLEAEDEVVERALVDLHPEQAPAVALRGVEAVDLPGLEVQVVVLEVLGTQEHPLFPAHRFEDLHPEPSSRRTTRKTAVGVIDITYSVIDFCICNRIY